MGTWEESSLIIGGLLAGGLAPGVCVLAVRVAPRRSLLVSTLAAAAVTWGLWLANWVVWHFAFDEPIPGETVPNSLFTLANALMHASSVGCVVLLALALAMLVGRGRRARALYPLTVRTRPERPARRDPSRSCGRPARTPRPTGRAGAP